MGIARYRAALATPGTARVVLAAFLCRAPTLRDIRRFAAVDQVPASVLAL